MKSILFKCLPKDDIVLNYNANLIDNVYRKSGFKHVLIEILKINKNGFLSDKQKRNLKLFHKQNIRLRTLVVKFSNRLMFMVRNKKSPINEYFLDFNTKVEDLYQDTLFLYKGLNKWAFTPKEINRLFITGILNYDMTESLPILMSNPYSGEKITVPDALSLFIQLRQKKCTIHYYIELFANEYFDVCRFRFTNFFILQRDTINNFINSVSKRELLDILESIKKNSIPVQNVLNMNPLLESTLRTVAKRELLNIPDFSKDYSAISLHVDNVTVDKNMYKKNKLSKSATKRKERRRERRRRRRNSSNREPPVTFVENEINRELEMEIEKEFEVDFNNNMNEIEEATNALHSLFIQGTNMAISANQEQNNNDSLFFVDWGSFNLPPLPDVQSPP